MRGAARLVLGAVLLARLVSAAGAQEAPALPGLGGQHPLDERGVGTLLAGELRCASCHHELAELAPAPPAPDLREVGARVAPDFLRRFLADPRGVQPGTKMPASMHALAAEERADAAEAMAHFLASRATRPWAPGAAAQPDEAAASRGEELCHTVGCVACHAPRRPPELFDDVPPASAGAVPLGHVPAKYSRESLAEFLFQPRHARPAGRMPDLGLSRAEAGDLASYLQDDGPGGGSLTVDPERVAAGARHFEAQGCASCHALEGSAPTASVPIEDPAAGCLDSASPAGVSYALDAAQRAALTRAVASAKSGAVAASETRLATTLTAFNCIGCHVREDYGGVHPELDAYFTTDEHDLGDDARIPPPLTLAGEKLDPQWMRKVIYDGASVRDYMFTRMPRFGEETAGHVPALFEEADAGRVEPFGIPLPEGEELHAAKQAGRELMGIRGLGCISCHDFNGTPSHIHEGVDLVNTTTRLQPDWFARFLIDPETYRPGVVMPASWPDGDATHKGILDGDTDAQVRALWIYLAQGRTARDPEGMRPQPSHLAVRDAPRTYRGRSRVAGFRGIAVGYPGGVNYAFDAQNGALAALWRGDFVNVRWDGQGAGDFRPVGRAVELARDVSFLRLVEAEGAWPLRPIPTDEEPINADPTYPRNHGYRFRGYQLGADSVPTLRYASGDVEIAERSVAETDEGRALLRRTLTLTAPAAETLTFRVLAGDFERVSERAFRLGQLELRPPDVPLLVRAPTDDGPGDVLLQLNLPSGTTRITIDYELLD
ncbi:MAG: hypothetical protein AAF682_11245 [Planctomycetota bacterium]